MCFVNSSVSLKALQSRTTQIILDETVRAYKNWLDYLKHPEKFKGMKQRDMTSVPSI